LQPKTAQRRASRIIDYEVHNVPAYKFKNSTTPLTLMHPHTCQSVKKGYVALKLGYNAIFTLDK